jgi:hypothetical protein
LAASPDGSLFGQCFFSILASTSSSDEGTLNADGGQEGDIEPGVQLIGYVLMKRNIRSASLELNRLSISDLT